MATAHVRLATLHVSVLHHKTHKNVHILAPKGKSTGFISRQSHQEFILHLPYRMFPKSDWVKRNKSYL